MARIRSIKPEFWTDETLSECSYMARLLFIATWNFADDYGSLERSAKQLKAKIFPFDNADVEPLIQELLDKDFLIEYEVDGKLYLHIRTFQDHQIVNRPSKSRLPPYHESLRTHGVNSDGSPWRGEERKGGSGGDKKSPTSKTELLFLETFAEKEESLRRIFPQLNFEAEKETCIAHYRADRPPLDPYAVITKWFQRARTPKKEQSAPSTVSTVTTETDRLNLAAARRRIEEQL